MKVQISHTLQVSEEQLREIGGGKRATREEVKAFIWLHGAKWEKQLTPATEPEDDDLLGDEDPEDVL